MNSFPGKLFIIAVLFFSFIQSGQYAQGADDLSLQIMERLERRLDDSGDYQEKLREIKNKYKIEMQSIYRENLELKNKMELVQLEAGEGVLSSRVLDGLILGFEKKLETSVDSASQLKTELSSLELRRNRINNDQTELNNMVNRAIKAQIGKENNERMFELHDRYMKVSTGNMEQIDEIFSIILGNLQSIYDNKKLIREFIFELNMLKRAQASREMFLREAFLFSVSFWQGISDEINEIDDYFAVFIQNTWSTISSYYDNNLVRILTAFTLVLIFIIFLLLLETKVLGKWKDTLFNLVHFKQKDIKTIYLISSVIEAVFSIISPMIVTAFLFLFMFSAEIGQPSLKWFFFYMFIAYCIYRTLKVFIKNMPEVGSATDNKDSTVFYRSSLAIVLRISFCFYVVYLLNRYFFKDLGTLLFVRNILLIIALSLFYRVFNFARLIKLYENNEGLRHPIFYKILFVINKIQIICILLLLFAGFFNLALYLIKAMLISIVVLLLSVFLYDMGKDTVSKVFCKETGQLWGYLSGLGYSDKSISRYEKAAIWTLFSLLSTLALIFISSSYGLSNEIIGAILRFLALGVTIGDVRLSLVTILSAILIVVFSHFLSKFLQRVFDGRLNLKSKDEITYQRTFLQLFHYFIILIGFLTAVNVIGFDLTTFAILGGALGVGIGFGLQNIVNNFISGLILMFEQPIKIGDIIEVGDKMGTVQKINIRSTVIKTFDRIDMILPNSDLISNRVSNWTHDDPTIRIRLEIGVAYGSNVDLTRDLLMDVAASNENVLQDPPPRVVFNGFGDSSLNFHLLCFVNISNSIITRSDLNFAINKAFKENKIEIPFPQRDLHLKTMPKDIGPSFMNRLP